MRFKSTELLTELSKLLGKKVVNSVLGWIFSLANGLQPACPQIWLAERQIDSEKKIIVSVHV